MKKILIFLVLFSINAFAAPVNINTADAKTIAKSLNGIGLKKAQAIVAYRDQQGNFKSYQDLVKVKGVGKKTIARNKGDILFADPSKK
ncbi:ComEA family DNA-binding protein [Thiolapillus sp.]|uniref:ComEA family DNA-binding protein n=1 Tax=Thiolapillus sp. TaxID=2017437 RepID=UPI003AF4D6EF